MEAKEYLKLATDKTEAGDLIKNNKLTEAIVKMLENYALIRVKNCSIPDVVNRRELLLDFADYSERDKTSQTTDECVDNYLDSIK